MTGFAFYSCDEEFDNPVQDATAEWNYEVSVKFADFKFWFNPTDETTQITDGVTGEPYLYKAPQTIYVYNMDNELLGSLTTSEEIDDLTKSYKFSGKLNGAIGESLMISTLSIADYAKQDGTLKTIVDNSLILENAVVPVRNYSEAASKVTTANAELQCNSAIARAWMGSLNAGDKLTFTDDVRTFEWTVNEDFDPTTNPEVYIAVPTNGDPEMAYTATTESKNGYTYGFTIGDEVNTLNPGEIKTFFTAIPFEEFGVDLTTYHAYRMENDAWYNNQISTGNVYTFDKRIEDGKSFFITQSGAETIESLNILVGGAPNTEVSVTLNNVRLGKGRTLSLGTTDYYWYANDGTYDYYGWSGKVNVNLVGENKFEELSLKCPNTVKGEGSWTFNRLKVSQYGHRSSQDWNFVKEGAVTYTIDKDIDFEYIEVSDGATLNIADGAELDITRENGTCIYILNEGKLNIGKANVNLITGNGGYGFRVANDKSELNIGAGAVVKVTTGNTGRALYAQSAAAVKIGEGANVYLETAKNGYSAYISDATLTMEKNAHLFANSDINKAIGYGLYLYYNSKLDLKEGATIETKGYEYPAIYVYTYSGADDGATISIAENASITANSYGTGANASSKAYGMNLTSGKLAINGKGTFDVTSEEVAAIYAGGNLTLDGASIIANGGTESPAIQQFNTLSITDKIISVKAKAGTGAKCIADGNGDEVELKDLVGVANVDKFNETSGEGVRTITPEAE